MPTSSQAAASPRRSSLTLPPPRAGTSTTVPPLPARRSSHAPTTPGSRRGSAVPVDLMPARRDSSIGATSSNPRLRNSTVFDAAAAAALRTSSTPRTPTDFSSREIQEALRVLRRLFSPVVMRVVLRARRRSRWKGAQPPRRYKPESVVAAILATKSRLADFPHRLLESLADGARFHSLAPREIIVYANESHVSCGIVVLLHGQLEERRPDPGGGKAKAGGGGGAAATRPIHTQTHRLHKAIDVLCLMPVLCEDRATSFLATRDREEADVAIIPSRWFWEVAYDMSQASLPTADVMGRVLRDVVVPHRRDILMADYFPTSVVLLRSWMWSLLTASDRVKLCRSMEVRVLSVGEVLFDEGEHCPYIYVVRRGAMTAIVKGEALAVLEPGTSVGEESVLFNDKRNCSVVAATVCEVYALHVRHLLHRFLKYPEGGRRIVAAAMQRQQRWMEEGRTRDVFGLVSILSGVPCLGHTTDIMREEMARCATVLTLPQGHQLVKAGTTCSFFCVIGRGSVTLKSVVASTSPAASTTTNGKRTSRAGKGVVPPPSPSPSSSAPPPEVRCEVRSAGDFFGELCLRPHQWPFDVVCDSTVCVWVFERVAVLRVLEKDRADAQAIEVCRQGISLYRAQRGEASIIEVADDITTPSMSTTSRRFSGVAQRNRIPSTDGLPSTPRARSSSSGGSRRVSGAQGGVGPGGSPLTATPTDVLRPRSSVSFADGVADAPPLGVQWTNDQWTSYAVTRLQDGLRAEEAKGVSTAPTRDLRDVDKAVEKAMKEKVLKLIAMQPDAPLNSADSDISGDSGELQSIIVEQLFLIVTEKQPRFLRQVNDSNVRLVTEEDEAQVVAELNDSLNDVAGMHPLLEQFEAPVAVNSVMRLEDVASPPLDDDLMITPRSLATYPMRPSMDVTESSTLRLVGDALNLEASGGAIAGWTAPTPSHGRNRRSASVVGIGDISAVFGNSMGPRMSLSRSHLVRPPSGVPSSPHYGNSRDDFVSPFTSVVVRPTSSGEPRIIPPVRVRPTSVDFNQFNSKPSVERSTSVLDRYVKIEDQNYFDNFVKVMALQQDEMWAPDEVNTDDDLSAGSMVLLLLHVAWCDHLSADVMSQCARPIVKVMLGQRVLVRTPVMGNCTAPRWPIDQSSFISFVRRGIDLVFTVCDADDESRVVYMTTLHTASIHENSGVEQRTMSLEELSESGSPVTAKLDTDGAGQINKRPRMTATMLAVTATKYKALRQHLETRQETTLSDAPNALESTKLFLQVMSVEGLKHRIEGSVEVSLYNGGTMHTLLDTGRVLPKTRSPAWSGAKSFARICGEGGIVTFDLQHKGAVIGSTEATVDELIFGGVGLRRLPLLQAQSGSVVMGQLVISVLGGSVGDAPESRDRDRVTHLAVEELQLAHEGFGINPDPFVVVRDGAGALRMRTPLACSAFQATWTMAEASCLLHCPRLSGSTVTYTLEVCDSDEAEVIGRATVILNDRGLGSEHHHEVPLDPPGRGLLRLCSLCLPVLELPSLTAAAAAAHRGSAGSPGGSTARLPPPPPLPLSQTLPGDTSAHQLLLLHLSGCTDLPGGASEELQTDAIGTFAIDAHQYLRTSLQEATTAPRWPFTKASVLLRIPQPPEDGDAADAQELPLQRHVCRFSVFDGIVDDVSHIGQVDVPLRQLLTSAVHTYPLFPKRRAAANAAASPLAADGEQLAANRGRTAAERTVGSVHLCTMVGRLNGQVETLSEQQSAALASRVGGMVAPVQPLLPSTAAGLVPYYNPDGLDGAALKQRSLAVGFDDVSAATVVLSLSNVCHVLPNAAEKYIHLVVRHGTRTILSAERQLGATSHAEWGPTEAFAAVPCVSVPSVEVLVVELAAMDVVEGKDEEERNGAGGEVLSPVQRDVQPGRASNGSAASPKMLLGTGQLLMSSLSAVEAREVEVLTVALQGPKSTPSASKTNGGAGSSRASVDTHGVQPVITFCVSGNRA